MTDLNGDYFKDNSSSALLSSGIGVEGEFIAAVHLAARGFRIVAANFKVPVGRNSKGVQVTGEIDLIALDGEELCFIEVKTRRSDAFLPLTAAVDLRKQRQIIRTARVYRQIFGIRDMKHRYDVVTVLMPNDAEPVVTMYKAFWNEGSFRKRRWNDDIPTDFV